MILLLNSGEYSKPNFKKYGYKQHLVYNVREREREREREQTDRQI